MPPFKGESRHLIHSLQGKSHNGAQLKDGRRGKWKYTITIIKHTIWCIFFQMENSTYARVYTKTCSLFRKIEFRSFFWLCVQVHSCPHRLCLKSSWGFFIKVLSTSELQQISDRLGCNGFSAPYFTSNLKCLRAFLSLVFTQDCVCVFFYRAQTECDIKDK